MLQKYGPTRAAVAIFDDRQAGKLSAIRRTIVFQTGSPTACSYAIKLAVVSNATVTSALGDVRSINWCSQTVNTTLRTNSHKHPRNILETLWNLLTKQLPSCSVVFNLTISGSPQTINYAESHVMLFTFPSQWEWWNRHTAKPGGR
jgi:hypothetical protein